LEGTHLLEEACAVDYPLVTVFSTPEWHSLHQQLWQQACRRAERAEIVSPEVLKAIATTVQPDGVVATAKQSSSQSKVPFTGLGLAWKLYKILVTWGQSFAPLLLLVQPGCG